MYNSQSSFIIIWDQPVTSKFLELLTIGIRNIVIAPITPQAVLAEVNKSVYQLSLLQQVMIQQELLQMMFDFQNDLLFIVEDDEIVDCNTNFLRFLDMKTYFHIMSIILYLLNTLYKKMDTMQQVMISLG